MSLQQRIDYAYRPLNDEDAPQDPLALFHVWFEEATAAGIAEPNAMTLATVDASGCPDARILLLRGVDERGFSFYTNYDSAKGRQLAATPEAALVFFWQPLHRQVRVRGKVARLDESESAAYFASRPRLSQLGAWASRQSTPIGSRAELEAELADIEKRYPETVPKPPHWGGFVVEPVSVEFWQGREGRLHDRIAYRRSAAAGEAWRHERLSP